MVQYCCVPQCDSKWGREKASFHLFPRKNPAIFKKWCIKLRMGKIPSKTMVVCSKHFIKEDFIHRAYQLHNPDIKFRTQLKDSAIPTINLPKLSVSSQRTTLASLQNDARQNRQARREAANKEKEITTSDEQAECMCPSIVTDATDVGDTAMAEVIQHTDEQHSDQIEKQEDIATSELIATEALLILSEQDQRLEGVVDTVQKVDKAVMWNFMDEHVCRVDPQRVLDTDYKVRTLTALHSRQLFDKMCEMYSGSYKVHAKQTSLGIKSKLLLTFMRLKLGLSYNALAALFCIGRSTAADVFKVTIMHLAELLKPCIPWLSKESIMENLPNCFEKYKKTQVVLDCTEFPVEHPACLKCRILTYSHYKKSHTCKLLVGVAPSGVITFLSDVYGGRASDKFITRTSGVLNKCEPYVDSVMVDKGFAIDDLCSDRGLELTRPAFLREKAQLSKYDGIESASISAARVHVERAISRIKVFEIFQKKLPWEILPYIDYIVTVCCASVNLSPPILSDDKFS